MGHIVTHLHSENIVNQNEKQFSTTKKSRRFSYFQNSKMVDFRQISKNVDFPKIPYLISSDLGKSRFPKNPIWNPIEIHFRWKIDFRQNLKMSKFQNFATKYFLEKKVFKKSPHWSFHTPPKVQ